MSGQKSPSRTLLQLLISEPATMQDGRMNTWFAQFLQRLVSYVGAVPAGSAGQSLSDQLASVITTQIETIGNAGTSASALADIQALQAAAVLVPPLVQMQAKFPLAPLAPTWLQTGSGAQEWTAGNVSVVGVGLTLSAGTLTANGMLPLTNGDPGPILMDDGFGQCIGVTL